MTRTQQTDEALSAIMSRAKSYAEVVDEVAAHARDLASKIDAIINEVEIEATYDDERVDALLTCVKKIAEGRDNGA